ncbi:MAG: DUF1330 domain-containing protein [Minwuiales bacterium]|nr:DUF1330 domain-containing protein [Minwuiales bacterium]
MPVLIVAQLKFTDIEKYRRYQAAFPAVFAKFNGRAVAADENADVVEGAWPYDKIVILEFPTREDAARFQTSPEYTEIAKDRKAGADATVILAETIS